MEPNYYSIIPATVRYDDSLTANAKLLYGEITALANQMGYCWASNRYFANLYRVSVESISRYIRQLKESGYITVDVIRKENKEVEERRIYINDVPSVQNCQDPSRQICPDPSPQNHQDPPGKNVKENTTRKNITSSNKDNVRKQETVSKVISYLNAKTAQNYRMSAKANQRYIIARLNEGYELDDFFTVIDAQNALWGKDEKMRRYLRPETLFGTKFDGYLNAARSSAPKKLAFDDEGWL